jgi:hypothetical protein
MSQLCEHLEGLTAADFPRPRTPEACEECLREGTRWVELRECRACGTSDAAIHRSASTPPSISTRPATRSCARLCLAQTGPGATSMS